MSRSLTVLALSLAISACDFLLGGTYEVTKLSEYVEYVAGRDLYREKGVSALKFACDQLRDQVVQVLHRSMLNDPDVKLQGKLRDEMERLGLLGAKREGKELHLMNDVTVGTEGLVAWHRQVVQLVAKDPENVRDNWVPAVIRRLFDSVVLHAGDKQVIVAIDYRHKCD
jgi:hypothetical protein